MSKNVDTKCITESFVDSGQIDNVGEWTKKARGNNYKCFCFVLS